MDSPIDDSCPVRIARIRELNDQLRVSGKGGRTMLTRAMAALPPDQVHALLIEIAKFDAFTADNDPWGEHDFGSVTSNGTTAFWKIDYLDQNLECGSPDAADETRTTRIFTVMQPGDL